MKFTDYNITEELKKSLELMGFKRPTDIQYRAIPSILKGEDLLAIAQTGTGKTAAFGIPIIDKLSRGKKSTRANSIRCLIMTPTRELAQQVDKVFSELSRYTKVSSLCVVGGVEQEPQIEKLRKGVDVLVSTPGRLFDLVSQGHVKLDKIEVLVLDEADHMLDLGFIKDIRYLMQFLPHGRQTLFFSATIDEKIKKLAYSLVTNPIRIEISPKNRVAATVDHSLLSVGMDDKRFFLERLINENQEKKFLVFVRTKVRAERVVAALTRVEIESISIHGDKTQADRTKSLDLFKSGEQKILIATDITARGIDIPEVDIVINYDIPDVVENYVHRVGRTGRAGAKGIAMSFVSDEELDLVREVEDYLGIEIKRLSVEKSEYRETIDLSSSGSKDWKHLMKEGAEHEKFMVELDRVKKGKKSKKKANKAKVKKRRG